MQIKYIVSALALIMISVGVTGLATSIYYKQNPVIKEIPTISPTILKVKVLDEIERCQKEKGNIYAHTNYRLGDSDKIKTYGSIRCEKTYKDGNKSITETLFDYNF